MMEIQEIIKALRRNMVETGSLICLGCGREPNCSTHGCAIMREAADALEKLLAEKQDTDAHLKAISDGLSGCVRRAVPENKPFTITLPGNIGDIVYEVEDGLPIIAYRITGFVIGKTEFEDEDDIEERQGWQVEYGKPGIACECPISEFGKSLFLTHKGAEQAIANRKPEGSESS